jgi:signal transduction histidine kinase
MLILLVAMAVLLPLLAALQYHWLGQVSEGASERMQTSLRAGANRFRQDFNREFIRAYLNFQRESLTPSDNIEQFHLERLEHWNTTAPYPRLISDLFLVDYDEEARPRLKRFNSSAKQFELSDWSGEPSLRERFERRIRQTPLEGETTRQSSLDSFAEDIPGLIIPFPVISDNPGETPSLPSGFTVVKLDLDYLKREFIPTLAKRHLFDDSQTEYNLAIVSVSNPQRVIYSSTSSPADFASSDVSVRIFALDSNEALALLRSDAAAQAGIAQPAPRKLRLINLRKGPAAMSSISSGDEDGRWQLLIKHQSGSLAAAVTSARHRNLAISFGILLLLGAGIFMTAISSRRAERLARQQINFVAGVTHELRTPLAVICSAGDNLAHGIVESPEKVAQYGEVINREGRRLTDMVEQVLEFAGAQSGWQRYEFRPTDVAELIAGAVAASQTQLQESDFRLETLIPSDLPKVSGDRAALRRAMQNLISNAIKYGGDSRWARINAQTAKGEQGEEVRITIEDRGLGIDAAERPHIFEPFYRGREALATQIKGSGVGLSLVKQIIEAHGGRISVQSTRGVGSTFTIHLPTSVQSES